MAIDSYGMYAGDATLDTITKCSIPLTYLTPQVENADGNIITDTLRWTAIAGTFVATGTEKYLVLGNFKSNAATNTLLINPPLQTMSNDVYIDDVSLIEMDLPAYAGRDTFFIPGDSIFIGREPDVGIDEACTWYKLPDMTNAIDTVAGLWIKPATTSTYVVRQQLWCSGVKWDTVVVYQSATGIQETRARNQDISIYPVPAQDVLQLQLSMDGLDKEFTKAEVLNSLGQLVKESDLGFVNKRANLNIKDLPNGVYILNLKGDTIATVSKRFVVSR